MSDVTASKWLERVYGATSNEELAEAYDKWADDYDRDLTIFGYAIPAVTTGFFGRLVPEGEGPILDAGCGTGIAGQYLALLGYKDLVGLDLSKGMLEAAKKKGIYNKLEQAVLGEPLDFEDDSFRAVVATGVFTLGHAPASAFDELVRVTKPGGHLIFSIRADVVDEAGYGERFEALERDGKWKLVQASPEFAALPYEDASLHHRVLAYEVV